MIADGDSVARNAFRVALREETPIPITLSSSSGSGSGAGATQELDPGDILEVQDMAEAIARAEELVRAPRATASQPRDLFESLGTPPRGIGTTPTAPMFGAFPAVTATDDTAGPASPAPPPSTYPPPPAHADTTLRPQSVVIPPAPRPMILSLPVATEDDAYYHPAGRIRGLADVTLDGYRPEPTLLVRARVRRKSFSLVLVAVLLPLMVLAAFAIFANREVASVPPPTVATTTISTATMAAKPAVTAATTSPITTSAPVLTLPSKATTASKQGASVVDQDKVPTFDVNNLPPAGKRPRR